MKKLLSLVLAAVLMVCCFSGCGNDAAKTGGNDTTVKITDKFEGKFRVGFARVDITPDHTVPLAGYGNSEKRMSTGFLDNIYVECISISDEKNNTVLMMSYDNVGVSAITVIDTLRKTISGKTGVPVDNIFITATHTHSSVDTSNTEKVGYLNVYNSFMYERFVNAAADSLNDRAPAKAFFGSTEATGLNFVRHYFAVDGGVVSDNHDTRTNSNAALVKSTTEADPTLYMLKFEREGAKDVYYTNWRCHPNMVRGFSADSISADFVGVFRQEVEKALDCYCVYYQGAAGNINGTSRIDVSTASKTFRDQGKKLAEYLVNAKDTLKSVSTGEIKTGKFVQTANINHQNDYLLPFAMQVAADWKENNNSTTATAIGKPYGIYSPYHANRIINNSRMEKSDKFVLQVASIGKEIGFAFAPYEMFDTNSNYIIDNSPFENTIVLGYTNGKFGYMPSAYAFEYGTYEADICKYEPGQSEIAAENLVKTLGTLK